ncbi:hypothetical protein JTB14_031021 [Gonioctena quinquepunctata]|nr:hypothetical protein JTB14_031021 [Gonioctena quinquepunctata]
MRTRGVSPVATAGRHRATQQEPDLVITHRKKATIVEFTVRYEGKRTFEEAAKEKKAKYKEIKRAVRNKLGCTESVVLPFVVGARGIIPTGTKSNLRQLSI